MGFPSYMSINQRIAIKGVIDRHYVHALYVRETVQEFLNDRLLEKNRRSLTTQKVVEYHDHPRADQQLNISQICALLEFWNDFLFKQHLIESPIWLEEDSEYQFGLNEEKLILKYELLRKLFQKALSVTQTIIDLSTEKKEDEKPELIEKEHPSDVITDEDSSSTVVLPTIGKVPKKKKGEEDEKDVEKEVIIETPTKELSDKAKNLQHISSSMRRERLRIQKSILFAISEQTNIDISIVEATLSEDVSRITGVALNNLSPEELQDSLLNVTKKMNIYRDILRNTELITKTQFLLTQREEKRTSRGKEKIAEEISKVKPNDIANAIQQKEEEVVANPEYKKEVENFSYAFSMDTDQFETTIKEVLLSNGVPESDVQNIISRTKAYALSRKHISSSFSEDVENFLLPIVGENGLQKIYSALGNAEEVAEIFEVLIEKTQIDWKNRTQEISILFDAPSISTNLSDEVSHLIQIHGQKVVGYAFLLSQNDLSAKKQYMRSLLEKEEDPQQQSNYQQEFNTLQQAQTLQYQLLHTIKGYEDNPFVRKTYGKYVGVKLETDRKVIDLELSSLDDNTVFLVQNNDYYETVKVSWEYISETPYYLIQDDQENYSANQQARWDSLRYRLASTSEQRFKNMSSNLTKYQKAIELAKKTKTLVEAAKKVKLLQVLITALLAAWPYIVAALVVLSGLLIISQIGQQATSAAASVASADLAKDALSSVKTGVSSSASSIGKSAGKALFSPARTSQLIPQMPFSLGSILSHLASIAPGTAAAAGAVTTATAMTVFIVSTQTASFLADKTTIPDSLESKYIKVKKSAESEIPFDNEKTKHLPNTVALESKPIKYSITIEPKDANIALKNVSFTDTTKITSRGPNYNDLVSPPVYDIVIYQGDEIVFSDENPDITNGVQYPSGTSDISINPGEVYTIVYTLNMKPEYDNSLITNSVRVKATAEITSTDGAVTTSEEETGVSLTLRIGNPPVLPSVQYAKSLAQSIYDNDPDNTEDVKSSDFGGGLTQGLIDDGFENVVGTLRGSAQQYTYLQCVGFAIALEEGMGFTLPGGLGTAQNYQSIPSGLGYSYHEEGSEVTPEPGDYAIFKGGTAGHIGMISQIDDVSNPDAPFFFHVIDANWNTHGYVRGSNEIPEGGPYPSNLVVGGFLEYVGFVRRD